MENRQRSKQKPPAADDAPSVRFSRQAERLWKGIPLEFRQRLLANVWCGKCAEGTTIVDFAAKSKAAIWFFEGSVCDAEQKSRVTSRALEARWRFGD